jgi:hypothetical protein
MMPQRGPAHRGTRSMAWYPIALKKRFDIRFPQTKGRAGAVGVCLPLKIASQSSHRLPRNDTPRAARGGAIDIAKNLGHCGDIPAVYNAVDGSSEHP